LGVVRDLGGNPAVATSGQPGHFQISKKYGLFIRIQRPECSAGESLPLKNS